MFYYLVIVNGSSVEIYFIVISFLHKVTSAYTTGSLEFRVEFPKTCFCTTTIIYLKQKTLPGTPSDVELAHTLS